MNTDDAWKLIEERINALTSPDSLTGLAVVKKVLEKLGNPIHFPALHIAGTNGKGSVAADLDAVLRARGYRTALYTSPHLVNIGERLRIDGEPLPPQQWARALDAVEEILKADAELRLGYFQITTAACFKMIADSAVDAAVIETGLGGRHDTTNILPRPLISIITPLGMDHMHLLGHTLTEIAANKFDIAKKGCPALYCGGTAELNAQFKRRCAEIGARGEVLSETCRVTDVRTSLQGSRFVFSSPRGTCEYTVALAGVYQPEIAALALRALELVADRLPVSVEDAQKGLAGVRWPGRMEVLHVDPDVILDGAHNPHGTAALIRALKALYDEETPINLVFTSMSDKDYGQSLKLYSEALPQSRLYCTELSDAPRCERAEKLARTAEAFRWKTPPAVIHDPLRAVEEAAESGGPVIVCGSLYFIGRIRGQLMNHVF